jgi:hypothetical protein
MSNNPAVIRSIPVYIAVNAFVPLACLTVVAINHYRHGPGRLHRSLIP